MDPNPVYPVLPDWPIDKDIYTGFWVNRSLGKFRAATITLDQSTWNLFIAFIALFVGATARSLWKLVRFAFHHALSSGNAKDGIHNQRQAVLRNTSLATDAAAQALEISHVWRHRAEGRFGGRARALALFGIAVAISLLTTAASFFSSKLFESATSEVLISGRHCGMLPFDYPANLTAQVGRTMEYNSRKSWEDYSYATRCYTNASVAGCDDFVAPALPYTSDTNAPCPFAPEMCKLGYGNLRLDTGEIDSLKHLGINKGPRFTLRYRTHCAPVVTRNFTQISQNANATRSFVMYQYGSNRDNGEATHWVERDDMSVKTFTGAYKLRSVDYYDYNLIPQLTQADGLVSLLFLEAGGIKYYYKTHDPWFSATTPMARFDRTLNATEAEAAEENGPYFADDVQVLGCATERFICNPARPDLACINTLGRNKSVFAIQKAWPNPQDQHQIYPFLVATYQYAVAKGQPDAFYQLISAPILLARNTMVENEQTAILPSNQWQLEREHIFKVTLAAWQSSMVSYARGGWWGHKTCSSEFQCERLCHSQRIRSASFHSISTWTLVIFLLSGIIFMIAVLYLEDLFDLLLDRTPLGNNDQLQRGHAEWKAGSTLQLQRLAHENLGLDIWKRTDEAVPVTTTKGAVLGVFNIEDKKHARLELPQAEMKSLDSHSSLPADETPNEEVADEADLGEGRLNVGGRLQYQRVPSTEHGSTW